MSQEAFTTVDIVTMAIYFVVLTIVFLVSVLRSDRSNTEGYFLANRSMNWFLIGMSLFSTNIGAEHFLGLSGSGAAKGISAAAFEVNAMLVMQMLSWIFLPVLISSQVRTLPEYFSTRFGGYRIRLTLAIIFLFLYIFTKVSVNLYAGALFLNLAFQINIYLSICIILLVSAIFTIAGGLASVMYTDTLMSVIMLSGGTILSGMAIHKVGGFHGLYKSYMDAIPNTTLALLEQTNTNWTTANISMCGVPEKSAFQMLRGISDSYIPWLGFILGHTPNTVWYWCSDQMMVQRVLAAKSLSHAKGGTLLTGYLKIAPLFLMVIVGMASRALNPDTVGCANATICKAVCENPRGCSNIAYPTIALQILPNGMKGVIMAVMISALISGLTSLFNSSSTLFTLDIYKLIRTKASNLELMLVGRGFALVLIVLSVGWIPLVLLVTGTDIYVYIQSINSFYAAPIASIYVISVFWHRTTEAGTFYSLICGCFIGTIRMILELSIPPPICGEPDKRFSVVTKVNFIYFSLMSFLITTVLNIVISLMTKPMDYDKYVKHKSYWTRLTKPEYFDELTKDSPEIDTISMESVGDLDEAVAKKKDSLWAKLFKTCYLICGIDRKANAQVNYTDILIKFNEASQTKKAIYLTTAGLVILAIFELVTFLIFSLPSLPLFT